MTKRRKRFSEREVIETLILQGVEVFCYRCKKSLSPADAEREHLTEFGLEGVDAPVNCAYSHKDCHHIITNGTTATSAGSSKHRIAKAKRIAKTGKMEVGRDDGLPTADDVCGILRDDWKPKRPWPSRPIPSRKFKKKEKTK